MEKKFRFIIIFCASVGIILYFNHVNSKVSLPISEDTVKSIYCEYGYVNTKIIPISNADRNIIISEISKGRKAPNIGDVATVTYRFIIELQSGERYAFIQDANGAIALYSVEGNFKAKIKAPQTAEFIQKFIENNNIDT